MWRIHFLQLAVAIGLLVLGQTELLGQAVQLPTFQIFSVNTTVSVPDSGSGYLGGVHRYRSGRVSRGIPGLANIPGVNRLARNQAIGVERGTSGVSVTAQIIDHNELDQAVLAEAARRRAADPTETYVQRRADYLSRHVARHEAPPARVAPKSPLPSVAEIERRNAAARQQRDAEAVEFFAQGQAAERDGKVSVAKIYYGMAARRATGEFQRQILGQRDLLLQRATRLAQARK